MSKDWRHGMKSRKHRNVKAYRREKSQDIADEEAQRMRRGAGMTNGLKHNRDCRALV